jgi:hypothetical protein
MPAKVMAGSAGLARLTHDGLATRSGSPPFAVRIITSGAPSGGSGSCGQRGQDIEQGGA